MPYPCRLLMRVKFGVKSTVTSSTPNFTSLVGLHGVTHLERKTPKLTLNNLNNRACPQFPADSPGNKLVSFFLK